MEAGDLGSRLDAEFGIEVGQRLVHEEHGRLADDRPTEGDALSLATGQFLGLAVEELLEVEDARGVVDPLLDLGVGDLAQLQAERQVVADGHVGVERVALEDHRDVAIFRRDVVDDAIADPERAVADLLETGDHPEAGRLAAPGRSDQDHELAVPDLEVEVVDGDNVTVFLGDVVEGDCRHDSFLLRPGHRGPLHSAALGGLERAPYEVPDWVEVIVRAADTVPQRPTRNCNVAGVNPQATGSAAWGTAAGRVRRAPCPGPARVSELSGNNFEPSGASKGRLPAVRCAPVCD